MPGVNDTKLYKPASLVTVCSATPVAWLRAVTLAPLTIAPEGSVTRPLMLPLPAWASAMEPAQRKRVQTERRFRAVLTIAFLLFMNSLLTPKSQRDIQ